VFVASYTEHGLCAVEFPGARTATPIEVSSALRCWHRLVTQALKRALTGQAPGELPPLDLSAGTSFQQTVWQALRRIPAGSTRSYGELARMIGKPGAARAVGAACGANPLPVLVPCHRVLARGGALGGFSAGLDWKRTLLSREGVAVD
jgi:O-6-methylguanine DNA methyltransferase